MQMYRVNVCHITEIGNKFSRKCCGVVYVLYEPVASVIAIYYISRRTVDLVVIAFRLIVTSLDSISPTLYFTV